jgi:hypothetical protein
MTLHITHNGPITTVMLDRPDVHNAFDAAMIAPTSKTSRPGQVTTRLRLLLPRLRPTLPSIWAMAMTF